MGRPSLGIISTTVRLPGAILARIDALLGPNRRAQFIREAVERELERREKP
ncbi:YlcI/YnfO family protein [Phenylobacterium immobile]|uniref:YlcI/YnfO family protein n=1 Tax=Phenylobacterium immobile TaxID=21 RepID=UPI003CCC0359